MSFYNLVNTKLGLIVIIQFIVIHRAIGKLKFKVFEANTLCPLWKNSLGPDIPRTCFETSTGHERCFYTHVPECASEATPLVYDMHGYQSCPSLHRAFSNWKELADKECMVVVWPAGNVCRETADGSCWAVPGGMHGLDPSPMNKTASCCCFKGPGNDLVDPSDTQDLAYLRNIASYVVRDVPERTDNQVTIDTKRIYMAGHSNGCMIAHAMAMIHSDFVAAVCCHAGTLLTPPADNYKPVPIWSVHGFADTILPYEGRAFDGKTGFYGFPVPSRQATFDALFNMNRCSTKATMRIDEGDIQTGLGCTNNATVKLLSLEGADHWPYAGRDTNYKTTKAAWNFCSSFESSFEPTLDPI